MPNAPLPTLTITQVEDALDHPIRAYAHQCHAASLALVRTGLHGPDARVARGSLHGIGGQHSWAVIGDPYDALAPIVDLTAWSYDVQRGTEPVPMLWITTGAAGGHVPHGAGHIMAWGCPESGGDEEVPLTPATPLSRTAEEWLRMFREAAGALDRRFWSTLASQAPVDGWPAGEFIAAMDDTPDLRALVPIDRLGMLTDRNPDGLYR